MGSVLRIRCNSAPDIPEQLLIISHWQHSRNRKTPHSEGSRNDKTQSISFTPYLRISGLTFRYLGLQYIGTLGYSKNNLENEKQNVDAWSHSLPISLTKDCYECYNLQWVLYRDKTHLSLLRFSRYLRGWIDWFKKACIKLANLSLLIQNPN
jgi:hypothetical protein